MEYCLPVPISQLTEYQLPTPRPPILRVPTELTSFSLPGLMWGSRASPGEGRVSFFFCFASSFASFSSFLVSSGVDGLSALVTVAGGVSAGALEGGALAGGVAGAFAGAGGLAVWPLAGGLGWALVWAKER